MLKLLKCKLDLRIFLIRVLKSWSTYRTFAGGFLYLRIVLMISPIFDITQIYLYTHTYTSKYPSIETSIRFPPLPGFESRHWHVRKLPVTRGTAVIFAGYSGFLHYFQLASHELATIGINVIQRSPKLLCSRTYSLCSGTRIFGQKCDEKRN